VTFSIDVNDNDAKMYLHFAPRMLWMLQRFVNAQAAPFENALDTLFQDD
jgi:hypothetical protein